MHTIQDLRPFGRFSALHIHHNSDWSGDACIEWHEKGKGDRKVWVLAASLLTGITRPASRNVTMPTDVDINDIPADVTGRAVALSIKRRMRSVIDDAIEQV